MNARLRIAAIVAPIGLLLVAATLYFIDVAVHRDSVPRGVVAGDVTLGGLTPTEAELTLGELDRELRELPITLQVDGSSADVAAGDLGLSLDVEGLVDAAMAVGRDESALDAFRRWVGSLSSPTEIPLLATSDEETMATALAELSSELVGAPPFDGAVRFEGGELRVEQPRAGLTIDAATARPLLESSFLSAPHPDVARATNPCSVSLIVASWRDTLETGGDPRHQARGLHLEIGGAFVLERAVDAGIELDGSQIDVLVELEA